ncbi:hypothetical protein [Flavobacterium cerinum]|uniref:Uncharacterized protein n=1 Tax=Flavobacterium cerinum TaxID=2502784 RepID=A0ABY5IMT4_9FLAO|nr:hypothetical protein [Flavobacterium cerinum]UUC43934.1 hypothetical protein NOX80_09835 [Flavobacterium cerinum]
MEKKKDIKLDSNPLKETENIFDQIKIDYLTLILGFSLNRPKAAVVKDENSNLIDWFFVDEYKTAKIFKVVCEKLIKELKLTDDVVLNEYEDGYSGVKSTSLANYLRTINFDSKKEDFKPEKYFSFEKEMSNDEKFSFLLGKFIRFYNDRKFILMDGAKNYVTLDLINSLCIGNDKTEAKFYLGISNVVHITLNPNGVLLESLKFWYNKIKE